MHRTSVLLLGAFLVVSPWALVAQDTSIAGDWDMTWANATRREKDGSITVQKESPAHLVIEQEGTTLKAVWEPEKVPEKWTLEGEIEGNRVFFRSVNREAPAEMLEATKDVEGLEMEGRIEDGRLSGVMRILIIGHDEPHDKPWSATAADD
jgi:hypothetical protein